METENKTVKGYKGFDKNLRCRDFQYEIGKEYETEHAELCKEGFHFCENPHDVLSYYSAGEGNRFAVVEASEVSDEKGDDSKRVSKRISVKAEISVFEICRIAVSAFFENFGFKKKIESADTNNAGNRGAANAGNCGAANAGDCGAAIVSNNGRVRGGHGCVLVARNIEWVEEHDRYEVTDWACGIVDGVNIKEDTWYRLKDGKLVECEELP